jgi:hypothetical protein
MIQGYDPDLQAVEFRKELFETLRGQSFHTVEDALDFLGAYGRL